MLLVVMQGPMDLIMFVMHVIRIVWHVQVQQQLVHRVDIYQDNYSFITPNANLPVLLNFMQTLVIHNV